MKKYLFLVMAVMSLTLTSCMSPEKKAEKICEKYMDALKDKDVEKIERLIDEETEYLENHNRKERKTYNKAVERFQKKHRRQIERALRKFDSDDIDEINEYARDNSYEDED